MPPPAPQTPNAKDPAQTDLCQDRAWLQGYRNGDQAALERVFRAYAPLVFHVLRHGVNTGASGRVYLGDAHQEDDVVQDTFIRLFSPATRARYDGLRPFGALVRVVARSALLDHLRKRRREALHVSDEMEDVDARVAADWTPGTPLPDQAALSAQEQQGARTFLEALPEEDRDLLRLRFEQGLTQQQAAEKLGISRQNLRTLEEKLRRKIMDFLGKPR